MTQSPHDALFRSVLGQPEHARGVLRTIVPAKVGEAIDWSKLTLRPGSFVDVGQSPRHTDLLYSSSWRTGSEVQLYLLFEHQSTPPSEGLMAHRLFRYMGRIWDQWRKDHPNARRLPTILPIVLYHGEAPWPEPRSFDALLDVPEEARPAIEPHLVRFEYLLHDLSVISDEELRAGAMRTALAKLVSMCFKHARSGAGLLSVLERWMDVAREVARAPNGLEALAQVIRYILEVNEEIEEHALQALLDREIGSEAKDTVMTVAQRYIEQGRQQGIEQGRQQAIDQVRQRVQGLLLRMLRKRFGDAVDAHVEERIAKASLEEVEAWSEQVLSATTLDAVFAD
jgi:predicted transposase/invertase (TIGR01784 family)